MVADNDLNVGVQGEAVTKKNMQICFFPSTQFSSADGLQVFLFVCLFFKPTLTCKGQQEIVLVEFCCASLRTAAPSVHPAAAQ